jgi:hypothetical protein
MPDFPSHIVRMENTVRIDPAATEKGAGHRLQLLPITMGDTLELWGKKSVSTAKPDVPRAAVGAETNRVSAASFCHLSTAAEVAAQIEFTVTRA